MTQRIRTQSTSRQSAIGTPIVLREKDRVRLVFVPLIIDNPKHVSAAVKGSFVYQRKRRDGDWIDAREISLATLKAGQGYQLTLTSEELLTFLDGIQAYYALHEAQGVPFGRQSFDVRPSNVSPLIDEILANEEIAAALLQERGSDLVKLLVAWAGRTEVQTVAAAISRSDSDAVAHLEAAARLADLKAVLDIWTQNRDNAKEAFWQTTFASRPWLLTHLFGGQPFVLVDGRMYVGGKNIFDEGGAYADFVIKNRLTNAMSLIEIKNPSAPLLVSAPYRDGVYPPSRDLVGAVTQVLCQRNDLQSHFTSIAAGLDLASFDPQCVVVTGCLDTLDADGKRCFELFRRQLDDVMVVTFDEVFDRAAMLVEVFEQSDSSLAPQDPDREANDPEVEDVDILF